MYKSLCHLNGEGRDVSTTVGGGQSPGQMSADAGAKGHGAVLSFGIRTDSPSPELQAQGSGYAQKLQTGHLQTWGKRLKKKGQQDYMDTCLQQNPDHMQERQT